MEENTKKKGCFGKIILVVIVGLVLWNVFKPDNTSPSADLPESKSYTPVVSQYAYNALPDDTMRELYKKIQDAAYGDPDENYILTSITAKDDMTLTKFFLAYRAFTEDHPEVFWLNFGVNRSNPLDFGEPIGYVVYSRYSSDELKARKAELYEALERFLDGVPAGLSERELQEYAHDYLIDNCVYDYASLDENGDIDSDYIDVQRIGESIGALVDGKAVCAGYATAYQLLLNRLGVDCVQILGQGAALNPELRMRTGKLNHQWNAVKNGSEWVMTDVTWDDSGDGIRSYDYFNIPIEKMYEDHNAQKIDFSTYEYTLLSNTVTIYAKSDWDCLFLPE